MQAIILAGGFGTRLRSVVADVPKPLAPVAGRPFLHWLLDYMQGEGVREAVLCVHHQQEKIRAQLGERFGDIALRYSVEEKPLGTGGAIRRALSLLKPEKPVFALNGDSLVAVNYAAMMSDHLSSGRLLTIATRRVDNCDRYSELTIADNTISHYALVGGEAPGHISTGLYVVSPQLFDAVYMPSVRPPGFAGLAESGAGEGFSFERDFLALHCEHVLPHAYNAVDYFIDIGVPSDFARAQAEVPGLFESA